MVSSVDLGRRIQLRLVGHVVNNVTPPALAHVVQSRMPGRCMPSSFLPPDPEDAPSIVRVFRGYCLLQHVWPMWLHVMP
jgi:hypothetical protein